MRGRTVKRVWQHDPTLYAPPRYRRACEYEAFVPDPLAGLAIQVPGDLATVISEAEASIARLNAHAEPALQPLARLLLRTESIASSKVEGMQVDARSLARAEAAHDGGRSIGPEAREILANIDAMQLAIERATAADRTSTEDLLDIHRLLMQQAPNNQVAGRLRDKQNWIGGNDYNPCGAAYVPPPPEDVAQLLEDLVSFCDTVDLPPLMQAAIAHAQFETIHPFDDGNGRTGRALIHILLHRRDLAPSFVPPISVVFARDKDRYIRGLVAFRENGLDAWLEIFGTAATEAAELAASYIERVQDLQDRWREQLRAGKPPRADAAAWPIIDALPATPYVTVAVAVAITGRTRPAVNDAFEQLEKAGVLVPLSQAARNRAWEPSGLMDLIVGLESGRL